MIIKVCGMTEQSNLDELLAEGVDWFGMIFYPKSKRYLGQGYLSSSSKTAKRIGVFVNASLDSVLETAVQHQLHGIQLHGEETPTMAQELRAEGYVVIKAIPVGEEKDLQFAENFHGSVDYLLFDTKGPLRGGNGRSFDWTLLQSYQGKTPFILAGGIGLGSISAVKSIDHPSFAGVDLNSGFESTPGKKIISRINLFKHEILSR